MAKGSKSEKGAAFNTPVGRVSYPHVFKKHEGDDGKEGKFEITLLLPKSVNITAIEKAVDEVGTKAFGTAWAIYKKTKPVVRCGDEWAELKKAEGKDAEVYRGHWYIKARTTKRPAVVGPDRTPIAEADDAFYGGCYARINVTPASYDNEGKGVTLYLNCVQKAKDGERFGGGGVDPDAVFDAFEEAASGSMGMDDNF